MFEHDSEEREARRKFTRRSVLLSSAQAVGFCALGWRLFQLQVLDEGRYDPLAEENRISLQVLAPKRGRILDRNGSVLADNDETFRAILTPALAGDVLRVLGFFRRLVPLRQEDVETIVRRARKQSRNNPVTLANDISFEQLARINLFAPQLPGVRTEVAWRRRYRAGSALGHVVGYVGSVERPSIDDDPLMRLPGMRVGKSGIEAGMESVLRGEGGAQKIEVDARGRMVRRLEVRDAAPGSDVALTIDADLQRRVFERVQREKSASCVVLDLATGGVVAMVSVPGFNPSELADGISDEMWQRLSLAEEKPLLNRSIGGQYPPGSTFKMVTALAGLQLGAINPHEHITCQGRFELADHSYRCWKRGGHGKVNLHDAIRESCDVYFFEISRRLGIDAIADTARLLGLGQVYNCGLPQQKAGLVADPDWKRGRWNAGWLAGETVLAGIGQGYMLASPLQLAIMVARVATGKAIEPTLIQRAPQFAAPDFPELGLRAENLRMVREGLRACVNDEGGTGKNARLGDGRPPVAGKTGTSQVNKISSDTAQDDLPWNDRDHALFVAYVPADAPRYAVAAVVEHGGGGGATAAPLVKDVVEAVLDIDPADRPPRPPPEAAPKPPGAGLVKEG